MRRHVYFRLCSPFKPTKTHVTNGLLGWNQSQGSHPGWYLKGILHPKMKMISSFTRFNVVYDLTISSWTQMKVYSAYTVMGHKSWIPKKTQTMSWYLCKNWHGRQKWFNMIHCYSECPDAYISSELMDMCLSAGLKQCANIKNISITQQAVWFCKT